MLLKYQLDWIKIVDFLLMAKFWAILLFFCSPSISRIWIFCISNLWFLEFLFHFQKTFEFKKTSWNHRWINIQNADSDDFITTKISSSTRWFHIEIFLFVNSKMLRTNLEIAKGAVKHRQNAEKYNTCVGCNTTWWALLSPTTIPSLKTMKAKKAAATNK